MIHDRIYSLMAAMLTLFIVIVAFSIVNYFIPETNVEHYNKPNSIEFDVIEGS